MRKIILLLLFYTALSFGQKFTTQKDLVPIKSRYGFNVQRQPVVNFNYFIDMPYKQQPVLQLAIGIQNDYLQFIRTDTNFVANYQISFTLVHNKKTLLTQTWQESARTKDFKDTNSRRLFQQKTYTLQISDLNFTQLSSDTNGVALLEVRDLSSSRIYRARRPYRAGLVSADGKFERTDISFLTDSAWSGKMPFPLSETYNTLDINSPYSAFCRARFNGFDSVRVKIGLWAITARKDTLVETHTIRLKATEKDLPLLFPIPFQQLGEGAYAIRITYQDIKGKELTKQVKKFYIRWFLKPVYLFRVDLAIRPMVYILSKEEMSLAKSMPLKKLQNWFDEWWKKRDPSPATSYNELMHVYFSRVSQAVVRFSSRFKEGWETDRGMIFLLYGEPDEIENGKYTSKAAPYLIWHYKKIDKNFTFLDEERTGLFNLIDQKEN